MSILFSMLAILAAIDAFYNVIKSGPIDRTLTLAGSALFFLFLRYICKRIARRDHSTPSSGGWKRFFLNLLVLLMTVSFALSFSHIFYVQRVPEAIIAVIVMTFLFFLFVMHKTEKRIHGYSVSKRIVFWRALGNTLGTVFLGILLPMLGDALGYLSLGADKGNPAVGCIVCAFTYWISNYRKKRSPSGKAAASSASASSSKPTPAPKPASASNSIRSNLTQTDILVASLQAKPTPAPIQTATAPIPKAAAAAGVKPMATSSAKPTAPAPKSPVSTPPKPPVTTPAKPPVTQPVKPVFVPRKAAPTKLTAAQVAAKKRELHANIGKLLAEHFPGYAILENIPFDSIISEMWLCSCGAENEGGFCGECGKSKYECSVWTCKCGCENGTKFCTRCGRVKPRDAQYENISFLLTQGGIPKLAIVLVTRRRWNHKPIRSTLEACQKAGIPWQRYFAEYDNKPEYILSRIRKSL